MRILCKLSIFRRRRYIHETELRSLKSEVANTSREAIWANENKGNVHESDPPSLHCPKRHKEKTTMPWYCLPNHIHRPGLHHYLAPCATDTLATKKLRPKKYKRAFYYSGMLPLLMTRRLSRPEQTPGKTKLSSEVFRHVEVGARHIPSSIAPSPNLLLSDLVNAVYA